MFLFLFHVRMQSHRVRPWLFVRPPAEQRTALILRCFPLRAPPLRRGRQRS